MCWEGYKRKPGTKKFSKGRCVKASPIAKRKDPIKGTGKKPKGSGRRLYTDENPKDTVGIKYKTPADARATCAKVKPGSKAAKRRKSFCARSKGWTGERGKAARRRWKC